MGGRHASRVRMEVGVEWKLLVIYRHTRCQKEFIFWVVRWLGTRRSAPYVRMGRKRPIATRWARKGRVPPPGEERRLTKEKEALARARRWLK